MKEYGCKPLEGKNAHYMLYYVTEQNSPSTAFLAAVVRSPSVLSHQNSTALAEAPGDCSSLDADGKSSFCVQGVDGARASKTRKTGQHYKYISCHTTHKCKPLYSTNKAEVKTWLLEVFGAAVVAQRPILARISDPTEAEVQQLVLDNADTSGATPKIVSKVKRICGAPEKKRKGGVTRQEDQAQVSNDSDQNHASAPSHSDGALVADLHGLPGPPPLDDPGKLAGWTRWMEVDSRRGCGSWGRRFLLLDDQQPQRQLMAVTAVEVDPENRTFFYQATEELGAHCFKSRSEAIRWLSAHFLPGHHAADCPSPKQSSSELLARTDAKHRCKAARREQGPCATFACDLDVLHWAVDPPSPELVAWAAAAAAQISEHCKCAADHATEAHKLDQQLSAIHTLLGELASPRVGLLLLARCSELPAAVAQLESHPEPDVAQKARTLTAGWADRSQLVESLATKALQDGDEQEQEQ